MQHNNLLRTGIKSASMYIFFGLLAAPIHAQPNGNIRENNIKQQNVSTCKTTTIIKDDKRAEFNTLATAESMQLAQVAQRKTPTRNKVGDITLKKSTRLPAGVTRASRGVKLKAGYGFRRLGKNKVAVLYRQNNGVTGSFSCGCGEIGGSCEAIISSSGLKCTSEGCGNCSMSVTVDRSRTLKQ